MALRHYGSSTLQDKAMPVYEVDERAGKRASETVGNRTSGRLQGCQSVERSRQ
jgi:hypothetical protein